jgi:putative ABC transport system permease protein
MMRTLVELWRWLRSLRQRSAVEAGVDDEIRFHVEQQTEKNLRAGMAPDEARRQALIRFGGPQAVTESIRDEFRAAAFEDLVRDVRYGARALRRAPGFTIAAALTLALGIGATTAMFSVVNGVVLRPLPYPTQDRLVDLVHVVGSAGSVRISGSPAVYFGYRDHGRVFDAVGHWDSDNSPATITGVGRPETVSSVEVTHEVPTMLGATPIAGRSFTQRDDVPGAAPTVMISYGYWQRRFGGAGGVGQTLVVDGVPREIIGVLPPSFRFFGYEAEVFYPLQLDRSEAFFPAGDGRGIALLKEGVTLEQANADVARIIPILDAEFPGGDAAEMRFTPRLTWLKERVVGDLDDTLWLLMGTIALLLAIACANVANLVLVRTQARVSELAVRSALGAGWPALARVVSTESVLLALGGGAAGLVLAYLSLPLLLSFGSADLPQIMTVSIDPTVLLVAVAATLVSALIFAWLPLFHFARPRRFSAHALRGDTRGVTAGRESGRTRNLLIVMQVALALVLLVGAGLMARTFQTLHAIDPGFRDPESVQTFHLTIPAAALGETAQSPDAARLRTVAMQRAVIDNLRTIPRVEEAGFSSSNDGLPLDGDGRTGPIHFEGRVAAAGLGSSVEQHVVSPGFFETLRTPLVAGRAFEWSDVERRGVVLVSENLARAEWGSPQAAIGQRIAPDDEGPWLEIVGVIADFHQYSLDAPPPKTAIFPAMARNSTATFVVRTDRAGTAAFVEDVRKAVVSVNGLLAPAEVRTLGEIYAQSMARTSMTLILLTTTGGMALLLGVIGVYGMVSYAVGQQRREISIRLALGAAHRDVRRGFVRDALIKVAGGVVLGLAAATGLTRFMASQLLGVSTLDLATHLAVALTLVAASGLASYLSAYRASTLDPAEMLKG